MPAVTKDILNDWGREAASLLLHEGVPLNTTITKIAEDNALNLDQIARLVESANISMHTSVYKNNKYPEFEVADIQSISKDITEIPKIAELSDYEVSPAEFEFDFVEKTASYTENFVEKDVISPATKALITRSVEDASRLYDEKVAELSLSVYDLVAQIKHDVKQAVLDPDQREGSIVLFKTAALEITPKAYIPAVTALFEDIDSSLEKICSSSILKVANTVENPELYTQLNADHPILKKIAEYVNSIILVKDAIENKENNLGSIADNYINKVAARNGRIQHSIPNNDTVPPLTAKQRTSRGTSSTSGKKRILDENDTWRAPSAKDNLANRSVNAKSEKTIPQVGSVLANKRQRRPTPAQVSTPETSPTSASDKVLAKMDKNPAAKAPKSNAGSAASTAKSKGPAKPLAPLPAMNSNQASGYASDKLIDKLKATGPVNSFQASGAGSTAAVKTRSIGDRLRSTFQTVKDTAYRGKINFDNRIDSAVSGAGNTIKSMLRLNNRPANTSNATLANKTEEPRFNVGSDKATPAADKLIERTKGKKGPINTRFVRPEENKSAPEMEVKPKKVRSKIDTKGKAPIMGNSSLAKKFRWGPIGKILGGTALVTGAAGLGFRAGANAASSANAPMQKNNLPPRYNRG